MQKKAKTQNKLNPVVHPTDPIKNRGIREIVFDDHDVSVQEKIKAATHPLLSRAIVRVNWKELEQEQGIWDFSSIDSAIEFWQSYGKKCDLRICLFPTPEETVPDYVLDDGYVQWEDTDRQGNIVVKRCPKIWEREFTKHLIHLASALSKQYSGNKNVFSIWCPGGSLGHTTVSANRDAETAFINGGVFDIFDSSLSPFQTQWERYLTSSHKLFSTIFPSKKILQSITPIWTRNHRGLSIVEEMKRVIQNAAERNNLLQFIGFEIDDIKWQETGFEQYFDFLSSLNLRLYTFGGGDDWPLYFPAPRPNNLADRDVNGFATLLRRMDAMWSKVNFSGSWSLKLNKPEIIATNPNHENYEHEVGTVLTNWYHGVLE